MAALLTPIILDGQTLLISPVRLGEMSDQPSGSNEISLEAVLTVLSDEHRRIVLMYLYEEKDSASVDELVDHLVENFHLSKGTREDEVRKVIAMRLHHIHLPMMDTIGLIEYLPEQSEVKKTDATEKIEPFLELKQSNSSRCDPR